YRPSRRRLAGACSPLAPWMTPDPGQRWPRGRHRRFERTVPYHSPYVRLSDHHFFRCRLDLPGDRIRDRHGFHLVSLRVYSDTDHGEGAARDFDAGVHLAEGEVIGE